MAIVDRMANISPTYLLTIAQVRTSCHFVHKEQKEQAHTSAKSLGAGDVLVRKHVEADKLGADGSYCRKSSTASNGYRGGMETSDSVNEGTAW